MKIIRIFLVFLFIAGCVSSEGICQDGSYRLKEFPGITGSLEAPVTSFHQDEQGCMWFGSNRRLIRFDGVHVKSFLNEDDSLINQLDPIREIIGIGAHEMLLNMGSGVVRFNLRNGTYRTYTLRDLIPENQRPIFISVFNKLYFDNPYLWIGTNQGLLQYHLINEEPEGFYKIQGKYSEHLNTVKDIVPADGDLLWIATSYGLYRFNKENKEFSQDLLTSRIPKNQLDLCMDRDNSGNLWIGHGGNLYYFDVRTGELKMEVEDFAKTASGTDYPEEPSFNNDSIFWNMMTSIHRIQVKNKLSVWIRTRNLIVDYNPRSKVSNVIFSSKNKIMNRVDPIMEFFLDTDQNVWISEEFSGINYLYEYKSPIYFIRDRLQGSDEILSTAYNIDVFENGEVWVSRLQGKGMARIDMEAGIIKVFQPNQLNYEITRRIVRDQDGKIWAIADGGIIYSCDPEKDKYQFYYCRDSISQGSQWFFTLEMDDYGNLWAGGAGSGLVNLDTETGNYQVFNIPYGNSNGFDLMHVWQILKLDNGDLLILISTGVIRLTINKQVHQDGTVAYDYQFSKYLDKNLNEIFKNRRKGFICGFVDSKQNLWLGTLKEGAAQYSSQDQRITYYNKTNGLASNAVTSIIEDKYGNIWFTSDQVLSRLEPSTGTIQNVFYWNDSDYPFGAFDWWDAHQGPDGYLYFGVMGNPIFLDPGDFFYPEKKNKRIVLSDFKVNNRAAVPGEDPALPFLISYLPEVRLNHKQHVISVEYGVMDYRSTQKYQYRYKLEGYDRDWILAGQNTFLSYSNIPAGKYILKVGYSDSEYFDEDNSVALTIYKSPAPWNTVWAWMGYVFFILASGGFVVSLIRKRMHMKHQLDLEHQQLVKVKELEEAKTRFFTQISHEIRTPLALILQPVEALFGGEAKGREMKFYGMIRRNAQRLNHLMDQMLDFSRIESGKLTLNCGLYDLIEFLIRIVANFSSLAENKHIGLEFLPEITGSLMVYFDPDQMEKVMNNLIANALKFTPAGGRVSLGIRTFGSHDLDFRSIPGSGNFQAFSEKEMVLISVKDTGIGIPPHLHERIFNRFDRGYLEKNQKFEGMGLGLSITKELVELHQGKIWVRNNKGPGSVFYVALPLGIEPVMKSQKIQQVTLPKKAQAIDKRSEEEEDLQFNDDNQKERASILFIEDNADMRSYVRSFMDQEFKFYEAENGEKGISQAREKIPDIIISDIMMPVMDGVEVVRSLKSDRRTCHIPIILLTAKAGTGDKINALKSGADDFIVKPFDVHELKYRIRNQLNQLKRLREQSIRAFLLKDDRETVHSRDDVFLSELAEVVNAHLEDPSFSVTDLCREMGVSRTQLFRKLKALTGKQPNEFIRCLRVKKAAELLKTGSASISEISYDTGFNSISYFSRCFKEIYHVTPTEYMKDPSRI